MNLLAFPMTFAWPPALAALLLVPALVFGYVVLLRGRTKRAAELAAKGFAPSESMLRLRKLRHVPYAFFLAGLVLLLVGVARPQAKVTVPHRDGTVILAFDVSNSMLAKDLEPTRIEAAKVAAREFVKKQPGNIRIGVVAFSDSALVTAQPTNDRDKVLAAIERLKPQGGTAIGQGIFASLGAIAGKPIPIDISKLDGPPADGTPSDSAGGVNPDAGTSSIDSIDIGFFGSAAIVMLSDGENTGGADPKELAKLASTAGVKINTVGVGSDTETVVEMKGFQFATALDEPMLQGIAEVTSGKYFRATDAASLTSIYKSIDLKWRREPELTEVTGIVAAAGTLLFAIGAGLSLLWIGRLV